MLHRSRSKDRFNPPNPVYMSGQQMTEYLHDLRTNRLQRPTGARPPPTSFHSLRKSVSSISTSSLVDPLQNPSSRNQSLRSSSTHSFHRKASSTSLDFSNAGRPLVRQPSESNFERDGALPLVPPDKIDPRQRERRESRQLRIALEEMDLEEEQRLHAAAQDEASELVWKHQNPNAPCPYKLLSTGSSHSKNQSLAQMPSDIPARGLKQRGSRSVSGSSVSGGSSANSSRVPSDSSSKPEESPITSTENIIEENKRNGGTKTRQRSVQFSEAIQQQVISQRKPPAVVSGKRKTSQGKLGSEMDAKNGKLSESNLAPVHFRNPFSRVRNIRDSIVRAGSLSKPEGRRIERVEIHRNPPSQSRDPRYTTNAATLSQPANDDSGKDLNMKDGKEIRSDDIRKATSMSLKDRSTNLPTPSMVSDTPGRPIVSFDPNWKPKEVILKEVHTPSGQVSEKARSYPARERRGSLNGQSDRPVPATSSGPSSKSNSSLKNSPPQSTSSGLPPIPAISVNVAPAIIPKISVSSAPSKTTSVPASTIPQISITSAPSKSSTTPPIPQISVSSSSPNPPPIPRISVDIPSVAVSPPAATPPVPSISVSSAPSISVSPASTKPVTSPTRPLPTPTPGSANSLSKRSTPWNRVNKLSHWTPANTRGTAACTSCTLPIAGRIVTAGGARFHPECFRCYHCGEGLECVAFYPEPEAKRAERLARIERRGRGEVLVYEDGKGPVPSEEEDGVGELRFYCHLDFHEFFSPRCKSCKTPIEGEVVVACGAEWHVGHFFCAQCGDPFDAKTPFVEKDGYAWCVNCHTHRYSTKCKKCKKPVTELVVSAMGAEWHEDCFCCTECRGRFSDGRYFIRPGGNDPFCPACEERRLKA